MKKVYTHVLTFFFSFLVLQCQSQWVSIPDTNFGTWLNTHGYVTCMQGSNSLGWQMNAGCAAVVNEDTLDCSGSNIRDITGIQYFTSLLKLSCFSNQLTSLPSLPASLTLLICDHNQLTSLPPLPTGLLGLYAYNNQLTSVPTFPNGIKDLWLPYNQLTSIPNVPDSCTYLNVGINSLTSLPPLPGKLRILECRVNQLTSLPALPNSVTTLYCFNNQLTNLPSLPSSLNSLLCYSNQLTSLPALPASLRYLDCHSNLLTSLPAIPSGLLELECDYNQLTGLPALPVALRSLTCGFNQLTALALLPDSLRTLGCDGNQLTSIPTLPGKIDVFSCTNNQLTVLPALPSSLTSLYCHFNQITQLPELPDSLRFCNVSSNPLQCLPRLKRVVNLNFTQTQVTCLPNYGTVTSSTPLLNTLPLCDLFNANGCDVLWNISGKNYFDSNSNCLFEPVDSARQNIKVQLWSGGNLQQQAFTGLEGFYSFDTDSFITYTVTVDTADLPYYVTCPGSGTYTSVISVLDSADYNIDFALECKPGFDLTAWSIASTRIRPGQLAGINISTGDFSNFYDGHCAAGVSGSVTITITGPVSYSAPASGALTPNSVSSNVLTYNIADFGATNLFSDFDFAVQTDVAAVLGSQVCITVSVTPTAGDNNPTNNTLTHCFTVVGSYDPNEKEVYPAGDIDTAQRWLTYTINFQNTGTDTAQHIYVTDTLDTDLDEASFQLLAYSHQPMVQIKQNVVRFNFPNINLPDSNTNEPASHGYVQYKVKIKDNKPIGTQINNTAFIYFDFNAPVVTNTTTNTISTTTGIRDTGHKTQDVRVFPNPATTELNIYADANQIELVRLFSADGKLLSEVRQPLSSRIDISSLSTGIYFVEVTAEGQTLRKRWVKM